MPPYHWCTQWRVRSLLLCALLVGCANSPVNDSARLAQQDSLAAVQIKARLLEAPDLAGSAIAVDLEGDHASLSGFVETSQQRDQAEAIAREQDKVKTVENNITVK
ncbi:BON domain-containing protein [Vreelandella sp. V005]|uniref:BON domain-containing protein n=1 Tax=Vreelandella sp. V005 TaxID=3459608 RepID=UPI004043AAD0